MSLKFAESKMFLQEQVEKYGQVKMSYTDKLLKADKTQKGWVM